MERGFIGLDIAVLAVSDAATIAEDVPARVALEKLEAAGHRVVARERIDDSLQLIKAKYLEWIADSHVDVVIVISGAKSEAASEALSPLVTKPLVGFSDLFRYLTFSEIGTAAMLVDAAAGQCKSTFIFVLPASVGAVRTGLDKLLLPQLDYRTKPTNLVMRMARRHLGAGAVDDEAAPKAPWILPKNPSAPVVAPPTPAKPRAGTEPGTPAAMAAATATASVSQRIAVAAISRPEPVSVSQRMSAVLEAAAPVTAPPPPRPTDAFATRESTDVGVPPPPPSRAKATTAKENVPLKPPAQITPLSQLLTSTPDTVESKPSQPAPRLDAVEELPAAVLEDIAPAHIVDDEPDGDESDRATVPAEPAADLPIPASLSTKVPTGPIRIEDEETREAILAAQKRAVTERVTPIDELPPRSVAIPARRKRDPKLVAIWSVIILASASLVVMFFIARERDRRAEELRAQAQRDASTRVADLSLAPTIETDPAGIPDAGIELDPTEMEIDMSADLGESDLAAPATTPTSNPTTTNPRRAATPIRPTRPPTTPQPRPPTETTSPRAEKADPPTPAVEPGCDEVSCVLDRYRLSCCAKYKPAPPSTPPVQSGLPGTLSKPMVTSGIAKVKPAVIACGEKTGVKGQVKISVTVSPAGEVTRSSVAASPDDTLGACVAGAVGKAMFAETATGGSFTYPFVF